METRLFCTQELSVRIRAHPRNGFGQNLLPWRNWQTEQVQTLWLRLVGSTPTESTPFPPTFAELNMVATRASLPSAMPWRDKPKDGDGTGFETRRAKALRVRPPLSPQQQVVSAASNLGRERSERPRPSFSPQRQVASAASNLFTLLSP